MKCKKCGSENVTTQVVSEAKMVDKHHGIFWWLFWGWYWVPIKWLVFTVPALFLKIFGHKKQKLKTSSRTVCVCQDCGNTWNV